jgi:large conductance mechanosensitive channel
MPPVGLALGRADFQNMYINLSGGSYPSLKAAKDAGAATINYGVFINQVITFVIVALVVFLIGRRFIPNVPTKVCPHCAADDLPVAATRCPHCTSDLSVGPGEVSPAIPLGSSR